MRISTKCSVAIHCLLFLHEYGEKQKVTSGLLALSTGCNPVVIRNIMGSLKKAGLVAITAGSGGARLTCPPEKVTLYQVCMAVEPDCLKDLIGQHPTPSVLCPVGRNIHTVLGSSYRKIQEDMKASLQSSTLADIVEDYHHHSSSTHRLN